MRVFEALNVGWLGGPFAPADTYNYAQAKLLGNVPLAAGENHYTRLEFTRVIEDRCITILQPDVTRPVAVSTLLRFAPMAPVGKFLLNQHIYSTTLTMHKTNTTQPPSKKKCYFK